MPLLFCTQCGYNMKGNLSGQCPECGLEFEYDTFRQKLKNSILKREVVSKRTFLPSMVIAFTTLAELPAIWFSFVIGDETPFVIVFASGGLALLVTVLICIIHSPTIGRSIALKKAIAAEDASEYISQISSSTKKYAVGWVMLMLLTTGLSFFGGIIAIIFMLMVIAG